MTVTEKHQGALRPDEGVAIGRRVVPPSRPRELHSRALGCMWVAREHPLPATARRGQVA